MRAARAVLVPGGMPRKPAIPHDATLLVRRTTYQRRWLLAPDDRRAVLHEELLRRAYRESCIELHACCVMPDEIELMVTAWRPTDLDHFLPFFFRITSAALRRIHRGYRGELWAGAPQLEVLDRTRALAALRTIHAAPVHGGLVAHPTEWPGVTSARALLGDESLAGIPLAPLPALAATSRAQRVAMIRQLFAAIPTPLRPMGAAWLRAQDPLTPDPRGAELPRAAAGIH